MATAKKTAAKTATKSTAVAVPKKTAVATSGPVRAKRGMEEADASAFVIPFLRILQKMSPALDKVKGAKAGMFIDTATEKLFTDVEIIPCVYNRRFIHWANRNAGGNAGFKGQHTALEAQDMENEGTVKRDEEGVRLYYPMPDGSINEKKSDILQDTRTHYVLYRKAGSKDDWQPAVIAMASSQIKKSKMWCTKIANLPGEATWEYAFNATTVKEQNDQGDWFAWSIGEGNAVEDEEVIAKAEAFAVSIDKGAAKANFEQANGADE